MTKYQEIIGGSWERRSLFPESVPHLFHYDMTYLWVLERQLDQRPKTWLTRVDAWKLLFRMFLLEQVAIVTEELRTPMVEVTQRFGVSSLTWLKHRQTGQAIGVLSPTVIVRPLPDFEDSDLDRWRVDFKDHELDFNHLVYVAVKDLNLMVGTPYALRIASILTKEFTPAAATSRAPQGRAVTVPILNRLTWELRKGDTAPLAQMNLLVRSATERPIAEYIPYCASCASLLLHEKEAPPVEVHGAEITVVCQNKECAQPNQTIPLELLGIWLRNAGTAVLWAPSMIPPMPDLKLPPPPKVEGSHVVFEWNKASIGGEPIRRFLRLSFGERRILTQQLMAIFFEKLLVLGKLADFQGRGVMPEWGDAIDADSSGPLSVSAETNQVEFRALKIRGWPVTFAKFYKDTALVQMPNVGLGLFPDPSLVGADWKWYRAFIQGANLQDLEVSGTGMTPLLSSLATTESGLPAVVGVQLTKQKSTGVCYIPTVRPPMADFGGAARISLAVDFGTTNTLVYHQPPREGLVARSRTHGLNPRQFASSTLWLALDKESNKDEVLGHFLPGPGYRYEATDPYLIPSEAWRIGRQGLHLIRWVNEPPEKAAYGPVTQFKWDVENGDFGPTRLAYLKEIILQALPLAMSAWEPAHANGVDIGFAYPLAFEYEARTKFRSLLDRLAEDLTNLTGLEVSTTFSINESAACVNAFGAFNGDTFLVADMGGGSLDLALFSIHAGSRVDIHQMGSIRFGGERCIGAMAEQLVPKGTLQELRDAIARGESHKKYGKQDAEMLTTRFETIAFEFLRTMVAAYRQVPGKAMEPIKVVLVGNGWHLVESFSRETRARGGKNVYLEIYEKMVEALGDPNLTFHKEQPLTEFPSSKHLVVAGTLQNVTDESSHNELGEETRPLAKLPAGRTFRIGDIEIKWSDLVGEGIAIKELSQEEAITSDLVVQMEPEPAPPPNSWRTRFASSVKASGGKIPYPTHAELLRELRKNISGEPPKLKHGPLEVILESEWARTLTRNGGSQA